MGGAMGALARFGTGVLALRVFGGSFPYGTLMVNVLGSFVLGLLYVMIVQKGLLSEQVRLLLAVGFLGSYTTFSTFALESVLLGESGTIFLAALNIIANVSVCLGAMLCAMYLARLLTA
nr:fluoride efflux transporter CrcB [Desulfurispira natronophila]